MNIDDMKNPVLVLVRGLPGSGKSYLVAALIEKIGKDKILSLDPDKTDYSSKEYADFSAAKTAEGIDVKFHPYRFLREQAYKGIEANKIVMWNQGFTNLDGFNKTVINLQTYATDHGTTLPLLVVEVEVNPEVAKQRVAARAAHGGHDVPEDVFARFINDYRSFASEGYNTVTVQGEGDLAASVDTVMKALQELK